MRRIHGYKGGNFKFSIFREDEIWIDYRNPSSRSIDVLKK
jgi:hypothetical protein